MRARSMRPLSFIDTTSASLAVSTCVISLRGLMTRFEKIAAFFALGARGSTPCFLAVSGVMPLS